MMPDSILLKHATAQQYCDLSRRAIRSARLNRFYPDSRSLDASFQAMSPDFHHGVHDELQLDTYSGLPIYKEWAEIRADRLLAIRELPKMESLSVLINKAKNHPGTVFERQLAKHKYYTNILNLVLSEIGKTSVTLVEKRSTHSRFLVRLDKLDMDALFQRYAIELAQDADVVNTIQLDEYEVATQSELIQSLVFRYAALDARFTFQTLDNLHYIHVDKVNKGTIGPFYSEYSKHVPDFLQSFVETYGFLASFALEIASRDIAQDKANDPLEGFIQRKNNLQDWANQSGVAPIFKNNSKLTYFTDRKFSVPRAGVERLRAILYAQGFKNIVYGF